MKPYSKVHAVLVLCLLAHASCSFATDRSLSFRDVAAGVFSESYAPTGPDSVDLWNRFPAELHGPGTGIIEQKHSLTIQRIRLSDSLKGSYLPEGVAAAFSRGGWSKLVLFEEDAKSGLLDKYWESDAIFGSDCRCYAVDLDGDGALELVAGWIYHGASMWYQNVFVYVVHDGVPVLVSPEGFTKGISGLMSISPEITRTDGKIVITAIRQKVPDNVKERPVQVTWERVEFSLDGGKPTTKISAIDPENSVQSKGQVPRKR